ncbi:MAG: hypothetical protein A2252_02695 [Elusimicrobia bacterium RIFOXYA2_FULL_39_19]|nr:MAG: hypothetical protein A2252_02695 [Elusimicrobia bacterium RIFOXYA2_FULL_39_19]
MNKIGIAIAILALSTNIHSAEKVKPQPVKAKTIKNYEVAVDTRTDIEKLTDVNPAVRLNSATILSRQRNKKHLPEFLKLLADPSADVRRTAVNALNETGTAEEIVKPVAETLEKETDPSVKMACLNVVARFKYKPSLKNIINLTNNEDPIIRTYALSALGEYGSPDTYALITAKIKDPAEGVKIEAMKVSAKLQIKDSIALITEVLSYPIAPVRRSAVEALGELGDKKTKRELEKYLDDKDASVVKCTKEAIDKIDARIKK